MDRVEVTVTMKEEEPILESISINATEFGAAACYEGAEQQHVKGGSRRRVPPDDSTTSDAEVNECLFLMKPEMIILKEEPYEYEETADEDYECQMYDEGCDFTDLSGELAQNDESQPNAKDSVDDVNSRREAASGSLPTSTPLEELSAAWKDSVVRKVYNSGNAAKLITFSKKIDCGKSEGGNAAFKRFLDNREHSNNFVTFRSSVKAMVNSTAPEETLSCTKCDFKCASDRVMKVHKRIHLTESSHTCSICDACFTDELSLERHVKAHSSKRANRSLTDQPRRRCNLKERAYKCTYCNWKFVHAYALTRHISVVHTGEHAYQCKKCDARFTENSKYIAHTRAHSGETMYQCEGCCMKFSSNFAFISHMRNKHIDKTPYKCSECIGQFASLHALNKHFRKHSPEVPFIL